jgi:hypothetical protein
VRGPFDGPDRSDSTRRPVVKHQRKPASGPADPQVETATIRQLDMIHSYHAIILA